MCTFTLCGTPERFRVVTGCVNDVQSNADRDVSGSCISVALVNTHAGFTCEY